MGSHKVVVIMGLVTSVWGVAAGLDCGTVTSLISACSSFITHGFPDPYPGTPCCVAMTSLSNISDMPENRRDVCKCFMDVIATQRSNATAIATVPGFCGVSLGFSPDANTDCEYII